MIFSYGDITQDKNHYKLTLKFKSHGIKFQKKIQQLCNKGLD